MKGIHRLSILLTIACLILTVTPGSGLASGRLDLQAVLSNRVPVLLEFGRGWCKPCKYMKPILDDMARVYAGRAVVTIVEMDENADLVRSFGIRMMPTQVFLTPDGKEYFRNEGILEREQIAQVFSRMGVPSPQAPQSMGPGSPTARVQEGQRSAPR
ncbi:MAG: thioredoxin family protein [Desulfomonilaceae bacterium]|nr:thioredoxin family protein [Desulfomonilaceae bacterium]